MLAGRSPVSADLASTQAATVASAIGEPSFEPRRRAHLHLDLGRAAERYADAHRYRREPLRADEDRIRSCERSVELKAPRHPLEALRSVSGDDHDERLRRRRAGEGDDALQLTDPARLHDHVFVAGFGADDFGPGARAG